MDIRESIEDTRKGFEESFAKGDFYNRQTHDSDHLIKILDFIRINEGMKILDLGTGSGYLAFPVAQKNPGCEIVGLDIVDSALEVNRARTEEEGIQNLSFVSYDGIDFPFENDTFDLVITRYALHHFPDIEHSLEEVSRVLKKGGRLFISDPCPNECDTDRFVDDYMRLKKDGHIKFYTKDEWTDICGRHGLVYQNSFDRSIRFPKKKDTAYGYEEVLKKHDKSVIESYDLVETDTELFLTEQVNNIIFVKDLQSDFMAEVQQKTTPIKTDKPANPYRSCYSLNKSSLVISLFTAILGILELISVFILGLLTFTYGWLKFGYTSYRICSFLTKTILVTNIFLFVLNRKCYKKTDRTEDGLPMLITSILIVVEDIFLIIISTFYIITKYNDVGFITLSFCILVSFISLIPAVISIRKNLSSKS